MTRVLVTTKDGIKWLLEGKVTAQCEKMAAKLLSDESYYQLLDAIVYDMDCEVTTFGFQAKTIKLINDQIGIVVDINDKGGLYEL